MGRLLFVLWLLGAAVVAIVRPGQLLEFAVMGTAGVIVWREALDRRSVAAVAVAAVCFLLPLLNTWPARVYQLGLDQLSAPFPALLSLSSIAAVVLVATRSRIDLSRFPRLVMFAVGALGAGGLVAALISAAPASSISFYWVSFVVPVLIALVVASVVRDVNDGWTALAIVVCAALVPLVIAFAAYILSFGVPGSGDDLVDARILLYRPHLFQDLVFGNVGHLASFALLVLPAALLVALRDLSTRTVRAAALLAAAGAIIALITTLSRSAMVIAEFMLLGIVVALLLRRETRAALLPLAALAALAVVLLTPAVSGSFAQVVPDVSLATPRTVTAGSSPSPSQTSAPSLAASPTTGFPLTAAPSLLPTRAPGLSPAPTTFAVGPLDVTIFDGSVRLRVEAVRSGTEVFSRKMPWGVGPGQYSSYDPTHTASHSLLIEILAEDGVLGAAGMIALFLFLAREGVRLLVRPARAGTDIYHLRLAAVAGSFAFLVQGIVAGAPLAIGPVNVWAALLWLQVGLVGIGPREA